MMNITDLNHYLVKIGDKSDVSIMAERYEKKDMYYYFRIQDRMVAMIEKRQVKEIIDITNYLNKKE